MQLIQSKRNIDYCMSLPEKRLDVNETYQKPRNCKHRWTNKNVNPEKERNIRKKIFFFNVTLFVKDILYAERYKCFT